jgi:hypothetical protein
MIDLWPWPLQSLIFLLTGLRSICTQFFMLAKRVLSRSQFKDAQAQGCERITGDPEVIGSNSQFLVCRPHVHNLAIFFQMAMPV